MGINLSRCFCLILLCLCVGMTTFAQGGLRSRVGVLSPINTTGESQYEALCDTIFNTVVLTLRLLGEYEVVEIGETTIDLQGEADESQVLLELGRAENLANIVFGEVRFDDDPRGGLVLELSVFDTLEEEVLLMRERRPESLLAVFDATDGLVAELMEEFSGVPIGFGALAFVSTGEEGSYSVYLDGEALGKNVDNADLVLMGRRRLELRQERMLGERVVHSETVRVEADTLHEIEFPLPYLLPEERETLDRLELEIRDHIENPRSEEDLEELFGRAERLLSDIGYSPGLERERQRFADIRSDWLEGIEGWRLRLRPRWIFPIAVGYTEHLYGQNFDHSRMPLLTGGAARRFGDATYLGLDGMFLLHQELPFGPHPLLMFAHRLTRQDVYVALGVWALPAEGGLVLIKPTVAYHRLSLSFYMLGIDSFTDIRVSGGIMLGYLF